MCGLNAEGPYRRVLAGYGPLIVMKAYPVIFRLLSMYTQRTQEQQPAAQTHAVIGVHFPEAIRVPFGAPSFSGGTPFFHKKHHGGDQCQPRGEQQKILIHCISPYIFVFFRWEA